MNGGRDTSNCHSHSHPFLNGKSSPDRGPTDSPGRAASHPGHGVGAVLSFCENSSVKGVPKIVRARSAWQRVLWIFAVVLGTVIATYQVYQMLRIYLKFSTTMSMERTKETPPFPDVTVCNLNILWTQSETTDGHHGNRSRPLTFDQFMETVIRLHAEHAGVDPTMAQYLSKLNSTAGYLEHFAELTVENKSLILDCHWDAVNGQPECNKSEILPFFSPSYGPCFTFSLVNSQTPTRTNGFATILYLNDFAEDNIKGFPISSMLSYGKGVRVMVHPPGTLPEMDRGFNIPPGHETTVRIRPIRREMLGEPYGECTDEDTLSMETPILSPDSWYFSSAPVSKRKKSAHSDIPPRRYRYTSFACENVCKQKEVIATCGCLDLTLIALPEHRRQYASCGLLDLHNSSLTIERMQCSDIAIILADDAGKCQCLEKCTDDRYDLTTYQVPWPHENFQLAFYNRYIRHADFAARFAVYEKVGQMVNTNKSKAFKLLKKSDLIRRNFLQLNVILDGKETTKMVDKPAISPEALFGNVGGILNLWIGITFITVIEVIDLVLVLLAGRRQHQDRTLYDRRDCRECREHALWQDMDDRDYSRRRNNIIPLRETYGGHGVTED